MILLSRIVRADGFLLPRQITARKGKITMREDSSNALEVLRLSPYSFRRIPTPLDTVGKFRHIGVFNVRDVRADVLAGLNQINLRDTKLNTSIPKEILESLGGPNQELFVLKNSGILVLAESILYDTKANILEVSFSDTEKTGVANGGHTTACIRKFLDELDEEARKTCNAYVTVEFIEGVTDIEEIGQIIDARNNSASVPDYASEEKAGAYMPVKKALVSQTYADLIYYRPNQTMADGSPRPIGIRDILSYIAIFDVSVFNEDVQPTKVYASAANAVKHFEGENRIKLERMSSLLPKILELRDIVYRDILIAYDEASEGRFRNLRGVENKKASPLFFIGEETDFTLPKPYYMPALAALRACVSFDGRSYRWKHDPIHIFEKAKHKLGKVIGNAAKESDPQTLGKDRVLWEFCYGIVENVVANESKAS